MHTLLRRGSRDAVSGSLGFKNSEGYRDHPEPYGAYYPFPHTPPPCRSGVRTEGSHEELPSNNSDELLAPLVQTFGERFHCSTPKHNASMRNDSDLHRPNGRERGRSLGTRISDGRNSVTGQRIRSVGISRSSADAACACSWSRTPKTAEKGASTLPVGPSIIEAAPRTPGVCMARESLDCLLHHLQHLVGSGQDEQTTDAALLDRYVRVHDAKAFEAMVVRHGPMVLQLCRRQLRQAADCEDAFQATFLTLARKAASIRSRGSLASWLYRVAYRIACQARVRTAPPSEPLAIDELPAPSRESDVVWRDLRLILDAEIARLSESHRRVLVLCDLEGKTHDEVAHLLGCPRGTVASHLTRARQRLHRRLSGRGWTLPAGLVATALAEEARAGNVPAEWVKAAAGSGTVSARAIRLSEGVIRIMWFDKLKTAAGILVAVLLSGAGIGVAVWPSAAQDGLAAWALRQDVADQSAAPAAGPERLRDELSALRAETVEAEGAAQASQPSEQKLVQRIDLYGDQLPAEAVSRMGTDRFRHSGSPHFFAYSMDGRSLVSSNQDGIVHVWDASTGIEQRRFTTYSHPVWRMTLSPKQTLVAATNTGQNKVGFWDYATGKKVREIVLPEPGSLALAFSPDDQVLVMGSGKKKVEFSFWNVTTGEIMRRMPADAAIRDVTRLSYTQDGRALTVKSTDGIVRFVDPHTGKALYLGKGFGRAENISPSYAIAPDGITFAFYDFTSQNGLVLWDLANERELARFPGAPRPMVNGVTFSRDGRLLAASGFFSIHLFDVSTQQELRKMEGLPLRSSYLLRFSADGKTLATAGSSTAIRLWDVATGEERQPREGHSSLILQAAFSPNGQTLATLAGDQSVRLWDSASGRPLRTFDKVGRAMHFLPDGKTLMLSDADGLARFELESGKLVRKYSLGEGGQKASSFWGMAVSSDGRHVTALINQASQQTVGATWSIDSGECAIHADQKRSRCVWSLSPDGALCASHNHGPTTEVCDVKTGKILQVLQGKCQLVYPVCFSSNSKRLAGACVQNTEQPLDVVLWDVGTGKEIRRWPTTFKGYRTAFAFSPDGNVLAAGGEDGPGVQLWDIATGKGICQFQGYGANVTSLTFSADGRFLAGGMDNGSSLVWNVQSARRRQE